MKKKQKDLLPYPECYKMSKILSFYAFEAKRCPWCDRILSREKFPNRKISKDGKYTYCKKCSSTRSIKTYYKNPEKHKEARRIYKENNPEKYRETQNKSQKKWIERNPEKWKEKSTNNSIQYREKYPERVRETKRKSHHKRKSKDLEYIIVKNIRNMFRKLIIAARIPKPGSTFSVLGYSPQELLTFLLSTLPEGETPKGKHIDHIVPISSFQNIEDPKIIQECFALTNLRYLSANDNIAKSNKIAFCDIETKQELWM